MPRHEHARLLANEFDRLLNEAHQLKFGPVNSNLFRMKIKQADTLMASLFGVAMRSAQERRIWVNGATPRVLMTGTSFTFEYDGEFEFEAWRQLRQAAETVNARLRALGLAEWKLVSHRAFREMVGKETARIRRSRQTAVGDKLAA